MEPRSPQRAPGEGPCPGASRTRRKCWWAHTHPDGFGPPKRKPWGKQFPVGFFHGRHRRAGSDTLHRRAPSAPPRSSKLRLVRGPITAEGESSVARVSAALCITVALAPPPAPFFSFD